jgi:hypothetical protein
MLKFASVFTGKPPATPRAKSSPAVDAKPSPAVPSEDPK